MPMTVKVRAPTAGAGVSELLSRDLLESHAGLTVYMRGIDDAARGHVADVDVTDDHVRAVVTGPPSHDVAIARVDEGLSLLCTCPNGETVDVCRHMVAVGVTLLGPVGHENGHDAVPPTASSQWSGSDTLFDVAVELAPDGDAERERDAESSLTSEVAVWLADQPADRLRELLAAEAVRDPEVHRRLAILAAADTGQRLDATELRGRIADAFSYDAYDRYGYVGYHAAWDWANDMAGVIDELGDVAEAGFAAEVVPLAEDVLARLEDAVEHVDDSGGHITTLLEMAQGLHARACDDARPDPLALAERLLTMMVTSEYASFDLGEYRNALGEPGVSELRRLAEQRWEQVPALGPGDDHRGRYGERFQLTRVMEQLADATGDLDEVVAVMRRDLGSGYQFLRLAEACRRHDRDDLALGWARRGLDAFPDEHRLLELIGDVHADAGRRNDAVAADRDLFAAGPSLHRYQRLRRRAEADGRWAEQREHALTVVRNGIQHADTATSGHEPAGPGRRHARSRPRSPRSRDGSVLVEILLWESESDAAWQAAHRYGCRDGLWLDLAEARGRTHPAQALEVYRRHLDRALEPADKHAYREVVRLLQTMRPLYSASERSADFDDLVADIRTTRKRRRTLMRYLDEAGL